ncbi:hypothetical protein AJ79_06634 [Helicocarpus griseus UAMH5409]|uniref:N-acetyltransferase domain-containing protein n=1 Tax=Helicocarpus griseus UAMH5409 TaxID=1447875 RepID=A0A2B7XB39_9EURO|nr:hypothetical protein AJ79_06634 [Helicocarpus griseus UAMH5409]
MHLRPLSVSDLPAAASLVADAMRDDEIWQYLCPARMEYYSHYRDSFLRRMKLRLSKPGWVTYVAVTDADDEGEPISSHGGGKIVGYAAWERDGNSPAARKWRGKNDTFGCWIERFLQGIEGYYIDFFNLDKSVDKFNLATYLSATEGSFPSKIYPELWYLSTLAVHPSYQRRGIGTKLVEWGMEQARMEKVPVGLEPSIKGTGLYEKLGFRTISKSEWIEGQWVSAMLWEPPIEGAVEGPAREEEDRSVTKES